MLSKKVRKFIFLVVCFFWVTSDLFFPFTTKPAFSISTLDTCAASQGAALCAALIDDAATKAALITSNASAAASQITTKIVQRGSEILLREVVVPSPFNATLGKWAAGVGLGGLLTFIGIPSVNTARDSIIAQNLINNPGTTGKPGQVAGAPYTVKVKISWEDWSTVDRNFIGPVSEYHQPNNPDPYYGWTDWVKGGATWGYRNYGTGQVLFEIIRKDGTSTENDIKADPNNTAAPTSWQNATPAQRESIVNRTSNQDLKNLYSVAPVLGVPSPSGTEDVYYKPQGSQEWVKLDNPNAQTINIKKPDGTIVNQDTNGDGIPDFNIDTNNDGIPDLNVKQADGSVLNIDTNGDGIPDLNIKQPNGLVLNRDLNGDGIPDINIKQPDGRIFNRDTNGDNIPDVNIPRAGGGLLNEDINGDGVADRNIDNNNDGIPDLNVTDSNGDLLNEDTNGDGIPDKKIDTNNDGVADPYQPANGTLDAKTFKGTFFVAYAAEKLSKKFPFDIIGTPTGGSTVSECPNYSFFNQTITLCILKDAFLIIVIPFKIGIAAIFYQKI